MHHFRMLRAPEHDDLYDRKGCIPTATKSMIIPSSIINGSEVGHAEDRYRPAKSA